jgi:hypothetical protein
MAMHKFYKTVLLTGLLVGTTDLLSAYISITIRRGIFPKAMLLYIAGGALGLKNSLQGGNWVALLGLFFHYFIAFSFTLFFFVIFPRLTFLSYNKYLVGMLYAVFVDLVVGQLILPLSKLPTSPLDVSGSIINWMTFGVVFGIPIAISAYRYYRIGTTTAPPVA